MLNISVSFLQINVLTLRPNFFKTNTCVSSISILSWKHTYQLSSQLSSVTFALACWFIRGLSQTNSVRLVVSKTNTPKNEDPKTRRPEDRRPTKTKNYENEDPLRKRRHPMKTKTPYENEDPLRKRRPVKTKTP